MPRKEGISLDIATVRLKHTKDAWAKNQKNDFAPAAEVQTQPPPVEVIDIVAKDIPRLHGLLSI